MSNLVMTVKNIKNINCAEIEFPFEKGLYGLIGNNGCGKSTLLVALSQLISRHELGTLRKEDFTADSEVTFTFKGQTDKWMYNPRRDMWTANSYPHTMQFRGLHEGSLFYGKRFDESKVVDYLVQDNQFKNGEIVDADDFIKDQLSFILHGDHKHYRELQRVKNKEIAKRLRLRNTPYFSRFNGRLVSQYRMSSGECLLVSLLHFIYNSVIRESLPQHVPVPLFIDEIELALHPIAVSRLVDLLQDTVEKSESFVVVLTSHAPEVIRKIHPRKLYKLENIDGNINVVNPCFPSYAIRDVYSHDGFDFLILVEDELAKAIINKILQTQKLLDSKLIHVVPAGGWSNVLDLHKELLLNNVLGLKTTVISILDGDIQDEVSKKKEYMNLKKLFLPIESIEKYLYKTLIKNRGDKIGKILGDKYFTLKSIDSLVRDFETENQGQKKQMDKRFFEMLKRDLESRNISLNEFIANLTNDIIENVDFSNFKNSLADLLSR